MGDYKSEMLWFIADDAIRQSIALPDMPSEAVHDFLNGLVEDVEETGQMQLTFDSYSNDQYVYLSLLLQAYGNAADAPLHDWREYDFVQLRFHTPHDCSRIAAMLDDWEAAFLADPRPVATAIQKELLTFDAEFAPRHLIAQIDADFIRQLYAINDRRGYHAAADSPAAALIASIPVRTNTLRAVNQSFGYIQAIRGWMLDADRQGMGLVSMIY